VFVLTGLHGLGEDPGIPDKADHEERRRRLAESKAKTQNYKNKKYGTNEDRDPSVERRDESVVDGDG
jgi:hypothetical protein